MNRIYNKEAINRIASEDRLDRMIVLATPTVWISIIGAFLIIGGLTIWGFAGKLPTSVDAKGIFMSSNGTYDIPSKYDGYVLSVAAREGERVKEGQLIATLGTEDEIFELKQLDTRIQYVEAITFESEYDVITTDSEEMAQYKLQARDADKELESKKAELLLKQEKLAGVGTEVKNKEAQMLKYKEQYYATLNVSDEEMQLRYTEANNDYDTHFNQYEQAKNSYINAKEAYYSTKAEFDAKYAEYDPTSHTEEENSPYYAAMANVENAMSKAADYESLMKDEEDRLNSANDSLESARKDYLEFLNAQSGIQASNTVASTEYAEVLTDYNAAKNRYKSLSDEIDELQLQVLISEGESKGDTEKYRTQFNNMKSAKLIDLNAQRDSILNRADKGEIRATMDGVIYDNDLYTGMHVTAGNRAVVLLAGKQEDHEVISYIVLEDVKKIRKGMQIYAYPSTVKKEEYGHITGRVIDVHSSVESAESMEQQLGSDALVTDFSKNGPVVMVKCSLDPDEGTASGFKWSSDRGRAIPLDSGTIVNITVITENKRPLDMLIPYLREKLDFEIKTDEETPT